MLMRMLKPLEALCNHRQEDDGEDQIPVMKMELLTRNMKHSSIHTWILNTWLKAAFVPPTTHDPPDREFVPHTLAVHVRQLLKSMWNGNQCDERSRPNKENAGSIKASVKLTKLSDLYQDDRGARWWTDLEEILSLRIKRFDFLHFKNRKQRFPGGLADWTMWALRLQVAFQQPVTLNDWPKLQPYEGPHHWRMGLGSRHIHKQEWSLDSLSSCWLITSHLLFG